MHFKLTVFAMVSLLGVAFPSYASRVEAHPESTSIEGPGTYNILDDLNPHDPNIDEIMKEYDRIYEEETGQPAFVENSYSGFYELFGIETCKRQDCSVWAQIVKSTQTMYLYLQGELVASWPVSTGIRGYTTPNFDTHPNGRIYDRYTSGKYPGGNYKGLGNMPYAVFIRGGYAIHGTPESNWPKLGTPASHGCIRLHPDFGYQFNRLVRQYGIRDTWITVHN